MDAVSQCFLGVIAIVAVSLTTTPAAAAAPNGRYTKSGGTVYDTKTKLTWQGAAPSTMLNWADAKAYCASSGVTAILGGTGRLPTVKELLTIIDYSQSGAPLIDPIFGPTAIYDYWSSSPLVGSSTNFWVVDFSFGRPTDVYGVTTAATGVRCVR